MFTVQQGTPSLHKTPNTLYGNVYKSVQNQKEQNSRKDLQQSCALQIGYISTERRQCFFVQKALRVVQFATKKDEWQWLLSAPSLEDKLIGVYDTVQRDNSPTHIVLCIYFAIEVEIDWMQLITQINPIHVNPILLFQYMG